MHSTNKTFNYEKKRWGISPIKNLFTYFQGLELLFFLKDIPANFKEKKSQLIDLGCGGGNICGFLKERFPKWLITGVDISNDSIFIAKERFPKVNFYVSDASKIKVKSNSVDIITAFDSLEHIANLNKVLDEVNRALKKNGIFYVAIPLEKQFPSVYWFMYKFGWMGKRKYVGHVNFFNNNELIKLFETKGFKMVKKRYSFHYVFSIFDILYYLFQSFFGIQNVSFESKVEESKISIIGNFLKLVKNFISMVYFLESSIFYWFPGGKGHYVFIKKENLDFFSHNPPVTVLEDFQIKAGLSSFIRPKDIAIKKMLDELNYKKSRNVLDFGCANGIWLERILTDNKKASGVGIDISERLINEANFRKGKRSNYLCNINNWPKINDNFDFCVSLDVFEHIEEKEKEIKKIYQSMKKSGKILFYTLNSNNKYTFDWFFEKLGSNYLYERADHDKKLFISPDLFSKILIKNKFRNVNYKLYAGPANLFWDVGAYIYLPMLSRVLGLLHLRKLMSVFIYINTLFLIIIFPINNFIDGFFFKKGYSNGYFIWGEK